MSTQTPVTETRPAMVRAPNPGFAGFWRKYPFAFAVGISIIMLAINLIVQPNFGPVQQLAAFAPLAVAAIASTPSILSGRGGLDVSISPVMTLSAVLFVGYLTPAGLGGIEAVPILMLMGAAIGAINGVIIVFLRLQPIVVTLSMMFIITGINLKLAPSPFTLTNSWVLSLSGSFWFIPGALISIAIPLAIWFLFMRTAYGRNLYAVGGNDATAFSTGINVSGVRVLAYAIGSAFAAFGGIVLTGLVSSADASTSAAYVLIAIAAVALGGTSLLGGRGGMIGAVTGAAAIFLVQNMLAVFKVPQTWLNFVYGALLLFAVVMGAVLASPRKEKK